MRSSCPLIMSLASGAAPEPCDRGGMIFADQFAVPFMQSMPEIQYATNCVSWRLMRFS